MGVFRDQTSNDYGVDFEIEIENNGRMEGHCLKVQVKSSDDLNIRNDGHATVGGIKQSTLNYWAEISYNQPVVGMAVDLDGSEKIYVYGLLFWQVIKNIEPSGDEIKRDDKGRLIAPPTKTVDFGNECDNQKNIEKLRKLAYGYSLRDFLNAHKWLFTNIKEVSKCIVTRLIVIDIHRSITPSYSKCFCNRRKLSFTTTSVGGRKVKILTLFLIIKPT